MGKQTEQPAQKTDVVIIKNFTFNPEVLRIKQGSQVTWENQDSVVHTIKSNTFNSGDLGNGDKFSFSFASKGDFDYNCGIHPAMKGKIIVE